MRLITAILASIYMLMSTGFTVHMHYCMGELVSTKLTAEKDDHACNKCGMKKSPMKNNCCKDEHKIVKNENEHTQGKIASLPSYKIFDFAPSCFAIYFPIKKVVQRSNYSGLAHAPPKYWRTCPIYKEIRNFRV